MRYKFQPRNQIFVHDYGFLCFAKNMGQEICKNKSKKLCGNTATSKLIILKNLTKMHLKIFQKTNLKNSRSDWWFDWYEIANKIKKSAELHQRIIHHKIIQKQL